MLTEQSFQKNYFDIEMATDSYIAIIHFLGTPQTQPNSQSYAAYGPSGTLQHQQPRPAQHGYGHQLEQANAYQHMSAGTPSHLLPGSQGQTQLATQQHQTASLAFDRGLGRAEQPPAEMRNAPAEMYLTGKNSKKKISNLPINNLHALFSFRSTIFLR